jgi:hypothetical protein
MRQVPQDPKTTVAYYLPKWVKEHIDALALIRRTNKSHEAERLLRQAIAAEREKERAS